MLKKHLEKHICDLTENLWLSIVKPWHITVNFWTDTKSNKPELMKIITWGKKNPTTNISTNWVKVYPLRDQTPTKQGQSCLGRREDFKALAGKPSRGQAGEGSRWVGGCRACSSAAAAQRFQFASAQTKTSSNSKNNPQLAIPYQVRGAANADFNKAAKVTSQNSRPRGCNL